MERWTCIVAAVMVSASLIACSASNVDDNTRPNSTAVAALSQQADVVTIAFTSTPYKARLADILNGEAPNDFDWVFISVPKTLAESGATANMTSANPVVVFKQAYPEVCNPALGNHDPCHIVESYVSGQSGLTGQLEVQVSSTEAIGSFDITWEGQTTRFGDPEQWYKHGTIAGYRGPIINAGGQP